MTKPGTQTTTCGISAWLLEPAELVGSLTRARVLVAGDGAELQHPLGPAAVCASAAQVHQDQVVVRAPCKERALGLRKCCSHRKLQQKKGLRFNQGLLLVWENWVQNRFVDVLRNCTNTACPWCP